MRCQTSLKKVQLIKKLKILNTKKFNNIGRMQKKKHNS